MTYEEELVEIDRIHESIRNLDCIEDSPEKLYLLEKNKEDLRRLMDPFVMKQRQLYGLVQVLEEMTMAVAEQNKAFNAIKDKSDLGISVFIPVLVGLLTCAFLTWFINP